MYFIHKFAPFSIKSLLQNNLALKVKLYKTNFTIRLITVKPVLTTTCTKRAPVNYGR